MRTHPTARRALWAVALLAAAGCGDEPAPLQPVRGQVYYRGYPLASGVIVFTPDPTRGNSGPQARAEIGADGGYLLRTGEAAGAVPGWHRVSVVAVDSPGPAGGDPYYVPRSLLPPRYADPELSGLACEVRTDQPNQFDLHLVD